MSKDRNARITIRKPRTPRSAFTFVAAGSKVGLVMLRTYLAVMAGGAVGVAARMALSDFINAQFRVSFPWGTVVVNVLGCFIIGLFTAISGNEGSLFATPLTRQVVVIGILGGFTTFSSFSLQTVALLTGGQVLSAVANVFLSLLLCLLGTWGGLVIGGGFPK